MMEMGGEVALLGMFVKHVPILYDANVRFVFVQKRGEDMKVN